MPGSQAGHDEPCGIEQIQRDMRSHLDAWLKAKAPKIAIGIAVGASAAALAGNAAVATHQANHALSIFRPDPGTILE